MRGTGDLALAYTADLTRRILESGTSALPMVDTTDLATHATVTGPEEDTELTLEIPLATLMALEKILQVGTSFSAVELPVATGTDDSVAYDVRGLPPGMTFAVNAVDDNDVALDLGVDDGSAGVAAAGTLPDNIGTYPVVYSATAGADLTLESDEVPFTITLADEPEAVTDLRVVAAGPSSLKVTWDAPLDANNAKPSPQYYLDYRVDVAGQSTWFSPRPPSHVDCRCRKTDLHD